LSTLGNPIWFATVPPWYTKLGLLFVQPTKSLNFAAVDLRLKKWPKSLLSCVLAHFFSQLTTTA